MLKSKIVRAGALAALGWLAFAPARAVQPADRSAAWVSSSLSAGISHETSEVNVGEDQSLSISGERVRSSNLYQREAGSANGALACGADTACTASMSVDARNGSRNPELDLEIAHADAGVRRLIGPGIWGVRLAQEQWQMGHELYRQARGVIADVSTPDGAASSSLTFSRRTHPGENAVLDSHYRAITTVFRQAIPGESNSSYALQAVLSREENMQGVRSLDTRGTLVRAVWSANPIPRWETRAALAMQTLRYAEIDPALGVQRADRHASFEFNLTRRLDRRLELRLEYVYTRFQSTVPMPGSDWFSIGAGLQWEFS